MRKPFILFLLGFLLLSAGVHAGTAAGSASRTRYLRFGVLPVQSPTRLAGMFMPLAAGIGRALGRPVEFVTAPGFSSFMARVERREYDIIYLNPLLFTVAKPVGYRAIVKVAQEPFIGILVVRKDSPLKTLDAATLPRHLRVGFPDPNAYAATIMTRRYLRSRGIPLGRNCQVQYFGSQNSVLMAVHSGLVDIAGAWPPALRSMPRAVRDDLRIIAKTPPQPQMPIAVRDDLPPAEVKRLQRYLISLPQSRAGRRILRRLGFVHGFAATNDRAYDEVAR
ncbi:MAG TPA: hypothetical protein DEP05_01895 [Betaproteobacteria bacterium]|nr:hypothetical protein [Betaproteobacteria bacterium]